MLLSWCVLSSPTRVPLLCCRFPAPLRPSLRSARDRRGPGGAARLLLLPVTPTLPDPRGHRQQPAPPAPPGPAPARRSAVGEGAVATGAPPAGLRCWRPCAATHRSPGGRSAPRRRLLPLPLGESRQGGSPRAGGSAKPCWAGVRPFPRFLSQPWPLPQHGAAARSLLLFRAAAPPGGRQIRSPVSLLPGARERPSLADPAWHPVRWVPLVPRDIAVLGTP